VTPAERGEEADAEQCSGGNEEDLERGSHHRAVTRVKKVTSLKKGIGGCAIVTL
jgi:hypothetical protein